MKISDLKSKGFLSGGLIGGGLAVVCFVIAKPDPATGGVDDLPSGQNRRSVSREERATSAATADGMVREKRKPAGEAGSNETAAARLARFFEAHTDIGERTAFSDQLIADLCEQGNVDEAYELIDKNPGQLHDSGLYTFFLKVKLGDVQVLDMMKKEDDRDLSIVLESYLGRFDRSRLLPALDSPYLNDFLKGKKDVMPEGSLGYAIAGVISKEIKDLGRDDSLAALQLMKELADKGHVSRWNAYDLVTANKNLGAFDKWDLLKGMDPRDNDKFQTVEALKSRKSLIDGIVRADAGKAMEDILQNKAPDQFSDIQNVVASWNSIDSNGVSEWYRKNQSGMNQQHKNAVAFAFANTALNSLEFDGAGLWANQIQDPKMKEDALRIVESRRSEYERLANQKP